MFIRVSHIDRIVIKIKIHIQGQSQKINFLHAQIINYSKNIFIRYSQNENIENTMLRKLTQEQLELEHACKHVYV